jgi:hypothetical protein
MKKYPSMVLMAGVVFVISSLIAKAADVPPSARESIEWCDIWISHANETNLPRVLLIGDSITRDYYHDTEERLQGKAYVARLSTSRFISDPVLLQEIAVVLDNTKFDIIHFNNGMHGWQHSEDEYAKAFPAFVAAIKQHAPKAKLIFATTTTLKDSKPLPPGNQTLASDERIAKRNQIARNFLAQEKIPMDDLNALCGGHPEYHRDDVHFNERGIAAQGAQVAVEIQKLLRP